MFLTKIEGKIRMSGIDLLLYNGKIYTMDSLNTLVNWVSIKDGIIVETGCGDGFNHYVEDAIESIDLKGRVVFPGFFDNHVHLAQTGLNLMSLDLNHVENLNQLFEMISFAASKAENGEIIRGIGFDEMQTTERRMPNRRELDKCSPNNPVWINRVEYHVSSVNTMLLSMLHLPFNLEGILRDEKGLPDGRLIGRANLFVRKYIIEKIPNQIKKEAINKAIEKAISKGVTTLNSMEGGNFFNESGMNCILENNSIFPIDVKLFYQTTDIRKAIEKGIRCIGGDLFLDGSFGSRTAALSEPYEDEILTNGVLYYTQEEVDDFVQNAHEQGLQISLHAIGEIAIDQALNAYEKAQKYYLRKDSRHRIEHFELATDLQISKAKELNIIASMQPTFELMWGGAGKMYEARLGNRYKRTNRFNKMVQEGLCIAGGSDSDVTEMNPILGIHSAVNHPVEENRVDVLEAIKMFTCNGAYAGFEEEKKGSIQMGKKGDFVILDKDPFNIKKEEIKDIQVMGTIKEGNILLIK